MKKFKVLDFQQADSLTVGSSLKGYINATYSQLLEILGEPTYNEPSGDGKVQVEWVVSFEGDIFTIYDWKTFDERYTLEEYDRWHVGAKVYSGDFEDLIEQLVNKKINA